MLRALQLLLCIVLAGAIGAVLLAQRTAPRRGGATSIAPGPAVPQAGSRQSSPSDAIHEPAEIVKSRNVGGSLVAAPIVGEGPLERVASLPQPATGRKAGTDEEAAANQPKRWRLVFNAVATSAGVLQSGDLAFVFPGIDVVSADETCMTPTGGSWPCGMVARTAFRNYLQGRALNCRLPDHLPDKAVVSECLLQGQDPAAWLVEHGWARSGHGGPFASLATAAKAENRGIYGQPPPGVGVNLP